MVFEFTVRGDRLVADRDYGFVEGNQNVYKAKFTFDDAWTDEYNVMCVVYSNDNKLVPVPVAHGECLLPKFAIGSARIGLVGIIGEDDGENPIISTNWVKIGVDKGANDGITADEFNKSVKAIWAQYYADMAECRDLAETYAYQAEVSKTNANSAASYAKASEGNAKSFADEAEGHANSAASSASDAQTSAGNAYNSEANASSSKEAAESAAKSAYDYNENAKHWAATAMVEAASIKKMTVSAMSGAYADVEKTETDDGIHLEFTLPKGEKGEKGDQGPAGPKGDKGDSGGVSEEYVDGKIAEVKPRIVKYETDISDLNEELTNNLIINAAMIMNSLNITFKFPKFGDMAALHFVSPEIIPTNYTTFPSLVRFKGDSTEDNRFVAEPNMYDTMVFEKLGDRIIGYVSGVTV